MAESVTFKPRTKQYLGNSSPDHMEVHDLHNEQPQCQVEEIITAGHAVTFDPDSVEQSRDEGYDLCPHCLGGSGS